jgi:hypothetical protein
MRGDRFDAALAWLVVRVVLLLLVNEVLRAGALLGRRLP